MGDELYSRILKLLLLNYNNKDPDQYISKIKFSANI
jgi:hypothetical protein